MIKIVDAYPVEELPFTMSGQIYTLNVGERYDLFQYAKDRFRLDSDPEQRGHATFESVIPEPNRPKRVRVRLAYFMRGAVGEAAKILLWASGVEAADPWELAEFARTVWFTKVTPTTESMTIHSLYAAGIRRWHDTGRSIAQQVSLLYSRRGNNHWGLTMGDHDDGVHENEYVLVRNKKTRQQ